MNYKRLGVGSPRESGVGSRELSWEWGVGSWELGVGSPKNFGGESRLVGENVDEKKIDEEIFC
jgi:hypothetical protein